MSDNWKEPIGRPDWKSEDDPISHNIDSLPQVTDKDLFPFGHGPAGGD